MLITVKSGEQLPATLHPGDVLALENGATFAQPKGGNGPQTIQLLDECVVRAIDPSGKPAQIDCLSPAGRAVDIFRIAPGVKNASIDNITGNANGSGDAAVINDSGTNTHASRITSIGESMAIHNDGVKMPVYDLITCNNGRCKNYPWYMSTSGGHGDNESVKILRADLAKASNDAGHVLRAYGTTNLVIGDDTLRLPGSTFAVNLKVAGGWVPAEALNLKNGLKPTIKHACIIGPASACPLDLDLKAHPEYRTDGAIFDSNEFYVWGYFNFGPGSINNTLRNSKLWAIRGLLNGQIPRIGGQVVWHGDLFRFGGATGAWPSSTGIIDGCQMFADNICGPSNQPNFKANWKTPGPSGGSFFNGKACVH